MNAYDRIFEAWHYFRKHSTINPCVVDFASYLYPGDSVLDLGCGTGYPISVYLSRCGFQVTGIDASAKMIEQAQSYHLENVQFFEQDFWHYRPPKQFAGIIAFDVLFHQPHSMQRQIYSLLASWLKEDGYLLFTHGLRNEERWGEMFGINFYYSALDETSLRLCLKASRLKIVQWQAPYIEPFGGMRDLLVIAKKEKRN